MNKSQNGRQLSGTETDHIVLHCVKLGTELQQWHGQCTERHIFGHPATSRTPTTMQIVFDFIMVERDMIIDALQHGTGLDQAALHNIRILR
jgi:hypothetical protein